MSALNVTPNSFSCVVLPSTASPFYILRLSILESFHSSLYSLSMCPCPMCMHLHFPKLNNICDFSYHLSNLSSCKLCLSVTLVTFVSCGAECVVRRWSNFKCGRSSFDVGIREADT